jgi:hypothetical protein
MDLQIPDLLPLDESFVPVNQPAEEVDTFLLQMLISRTYNCKSDGSLKSSTRSTFRLSTAEKSFNVARTTSIDFYAFLQR